MNRRHYLQVSISTCLAGLGGCLRLTQSGENQPGTTTANPNDSADPNSQQSTPTTEARQLSEINLDQSASFTDIYGRRVSHDGDFFFNDSRGHVWRVSSNGEILWRAQYSQPLHRPSRTPVTHFSSDSIYWGYEYDGDDNNNDGRSAKVVRRDLETGKKQWEFEADHGVAVNSIVQVPPDEIVVGTSAVDSGDKNTPEAYGVDIETGEVRWQTPPSSESFDDLVVHDSELYGVRNGDVFRVVPGEKPTRMLENVGITASVSSDGSGVYFGHPDINAVDLNSMEVRWTQSPSGQVEVTSVADGRLLVGTDTGYVYQLNPNTGEVMWKNRVSSSVYQLKFTDGVVWVPDGKSLKAFATEGGKKLFDSGFFSDDTFHDDFETTENTLCHHGEQGDLILYEVSLVWSDTPQS